MGGCQTGMGPSACVVGMAAICGAARLCRNHAFSRNRSHHDGTLVNVQLGECIPPGVLIRLPPVLHPGRAAHPSGAAAFGVSLSFRVLALSLLWDPAGSAIRCPPAA